METKTITIILILILILINTIDIKFKLNKPKNKSDTEPSIDSKDFNLGVNYALTLFRLCLFKMWKDDDILDFDNMDETIKNNLNNITNNQQQLVKLNENLKQHIQSKNNPGIGLSEENGEKEW